MPVPAWITAFIDIPARDWDAARAFWTAVTGYGLSAPRGEHADFQTLLPPDADGYLRVQRLHDGGPRLHLDLHVADRRAAADAAVALGATEVAAPGHIVMASPGGMPFCFVAESGEAQPATPAGWASSAGEAATSTGAGGVVHRSIVDQVALDIPAEHWPAEVEFWSRLTGWGVASWQDEFAPLVRQPDRPLRLLPHRLGEPTGPVRAHLDLASTDRRAEIARHVALGAVVEAERGEWTVLRAPDGRRYCVTDRDPDTGLPRAV